QSSGRQSEDQEDQGRRRQSSGIPRRDRVEKRGHEPRRGEREDRSRRKSERHSTQGLSEKQRQDVGRPGADRDSYRDLAPPLHRRGGGEGGRSERAQGESESGKGGEQQSREPFSSKGVRDDLRQRSREIEREVGIERRDDPPDASLDLRA